MTFFIQPVLSKKTLYALIHPKCV